MAGVERRLHEQLQICPQLWAPVRELGEHERACIGPSGPRCTATRFPARRHQHYCDGRAEAAAMDAAEQGVAARVPPVSLLADEPFFASWSGPKLDWPGYTVTPDAGWDVSEALAVDRRWHRLYFETDDSRLGNASVFAELRRDANLREDTRLPPWLLIRRVLQILESRLNMHGRRLWWRSVFYAPPGFATESDSRVHPTNAALIAHMRLAGLGERVFTPARLQLLGKELALLGGLPLERTFVNFNGWMGGRTWYASGHRFGPGHPLMHQLPTPWWCPQRNAWVGQGCCSTCVLPPNFVLPYIPGTGRGCEDTSDTRTQQAILTALLDLDARQRQLCGAHALKDRETAAYADFTCQGCASWAKGPPSRWWREYALMYWTDDSKLTDEGKAEAMAAAEGAAKAHGFGPEELEAAAKAASEVMESGAFKLEMVAWPEDDRQYPRPLGEGTFTLHSSRPRVSFTLALPEGTSIDVEALLSREHLVGDRPGASSVNLWSKDKNWGRLGTTKATTSFALALQDEPANWGSKLTSFAFAAPGFCPEHWQVGRATMTALGFRAVHAGDVKRLCQDPGGVAELDLATLPEAERRQQKLTYADDIESIPYARWAPAHGERSAREHLAARRAELQQHVIDALYEPDGKSRVDRVARCILSSPIPELPLPELLPSASTNEVSEAADALAILCVPCN